MARLHLYQFITPDIKIMTPCIFCRLRQSLHQLLQWVFLRFQKQEEVPKEVKAALQECQNMEQLLDLLFATDFHRDEAFLALFEKRIQEIDTPF
jgi:hypothetical protein